MHSEQIFNRTHLCRYFLILSRCEATKHKKVQANTLDNVITTPKKRHYSGCVNQICW